MEQNQNKIKTKSKQNRSSNLELYRIVCMLLIVSAHLVFNSGSMGVINDDCLSKNSLFLSIFGMWGKTGINCFMMITGYFMCTSQITLKKFLKLIGEIYLYKIVIFFIFYCFNYESISVVRLAKIISPIWNIKANFTSCFVVFFLTIPFLNILIQNMTQKQHQYLLALTLGIYTIMGSVPNFDVKFNYVTWFGIIYFLASYIRLYPTPIMERKNLWMFLTIVCIVLAIASGVVMDVLNKPNKFHCFVSDSNKIFAVAVAVCSFLWFKNMKISYSKVINTIGASTFGVLLIHANSDAMRQWLWKDTIDVVSHFSLDFGHFVLFCIGMVLGIFTICILIDQLRIRLLETPIFNWLERKYDL